MPYKHEPILIHIFCQIYDELQIVHERCTKLEDELMDNHVVTVENKKKEDKLYQRVTILEEENKELFKKVLSLVMKENNTNERRQFYEDRFTDLSYNHNLLVTHVNGIIMELNNIITILNNKEEAN